MERCLGRMSQDQKERDSEDLGGSEPGPLRGLLPPVSPPHWLRSSAAGHPASAMTAQPQVCLPRLCIPQPHPAWQPTRGSRGFPGGRIWVTLFQVVFLCNLLSPPVQLVKPGPCILLFPSKSSCHILCHLLYQQMFFLLLPVTVFCFPWTN